MAGYATLKPLAAAVSLGSSNIGETHALKAELTIVDGAHERRTYVHVPVSEFEQAILVGTVLTPASVTPTLNIGMMLATGVAGFSQSSLIVLPELDWEYLREWEPSRVIYGPLDDAAVYYDFGGDLVAIGADTSQVFLLTADVGGRNTDDSQVESGRLALRVDREQFDAAFDALLAIIRRR